MKKLFIHNLLFRLIGPLFIGTIMYLLILLINNSIGQVGDLFASQELYLCVFLVYLILEVSRIFIIQVSKWTSSFSFSRQVIAQFLVASGILILSIYFVIKFYYQEVLGFAASGSEYAIFFSIYGFMLIMYLALHFSHLFLYKENKLKLEEEKVLKEGLEFEFRNFKRGMNPNLLLESLESLIVISEEKIDSADELIDELSVVYRYILSNNRSELSSVNDELDAVQHLINLFWYQGIDVDFKTTKFDDELCVPGTFMTVIEWLIRASIHSTMQYLTISIFCEKDFIVVSSSRKEKLSPPKLDLIDINRTYQFYTEHPIDINTEEGETIIKVPLLIPTEPVAV